MSTRSKEVKKDGTQDDREPTAKEIAVAKMKEQHGKSLADFELEEDEDVYDLVDEKEYASVVESRRQKGDFVVDDGK